MNLVIFEIIVDSSTRNVMSGVLDVAIKEKESYILNKNSMIIDTNPRISNAINSSSMLSFNSWL